MKPADVTCGECGDHYSTETKVSWWLEYDRCYGCLQPADSDRCPTQSQKAQYRYQQPEQLCLFDLFGEPADDCS